MHACMCVCTFSRIQLFLTPWTVPCQAPLTIEFTRQEYWSGLPFPSPGDLPDPGIETASLMSLALTGEFFISRATGKPLHMHTCVQKIKFKHHTHTHTHIHTHTNFL